MEQMGIIKWFGRCGPNGEVRRYGFIQPHNGEEDVFVHLNDTGGVMLKQGDTVSFQVEEKDGRRKALGVRVIQP